MNDGGSIQIEVPQRWKKNFNIKYGLLAFYEYI